MMNKSVMTTYTLAMILATVAATDLQTCVRCPDSICFSNNKASIWSNGECVFNGRVDAKTIFYTGHVFGFGVCPAVQLQVGKKCFRDMAGSIAVQLGNTSRFDLLANCEIVPTDTPCSYSAEKFQFETSGYNCADVKILADNAVEECIRNDADGRFWATIGYFMGVLILPFICAAFCVIGCMS